MREKPVPAEIEERPSATSEQQGRRLIFNGAVGAAAAPAAEPAPKVNRAAKKRRRSTLGRIGLLFVVSAFIVFYVWNKITVNHLLLEKSELEDAYRKLQAANDVLRAEINRKASLERVAGVAGQYGLVKPKQQPVWFEVPAEDFDRVRGR